MHSIVSGFKSEEMEPLNIFVGAVANEMNRDSYIFNKFSVSSYTDLVIPRLEKISHIAQNFPRVLAYITNCASILWVVFLYPVLLLIQVVLSLRHVKIGKTEIKGDVFFATSKTSFLFSRSSGFQGMHICLSKRLERAGAQTTSVGSIVDYVIFADIYFAFLCAARALVHLSKKGLIPGTAFQVYAAFEWFLIWSILNRNAGSVTSLWISNDSDRWAVLVDQLKTRAKKIIVQHGLLSDPASHVGFRNATSLPTRLRNIDKIVLFDDASEDKYRRLIITNDSKTRFICSDVMQIKRQPEVDGLTLIRVIIIGQRIYLERECELANYLVETIAGACIFLRPHPDSSFAHYQRLLDKRVVLIHDLYEYPYAEICICFDFSSLCNLYEKQGAKVIYLSNKKFDLQFKESIRNRIMFIGGLVNYKIQIENLDALTVSDRWGKML